jgi:hypothetical protein
VAGARTPTRVHRHIGHDSGSPQRSAQNRGREHADDACVLHQP